MPVINRAHGELTSYLMNEPKKYDYHRFHEPVIHTITRRAFSLEQYSKMQAIHLCYCY